MTFLNDKHGHQYINTDKHPWINSSIIYYSIWSLLLYHLLCLHLFSFLFSFTRDDFPIPVHPTAYLCLHSSRLNPYHFRICNSQRSQWRVIIVPRIWHIVLYLSLHHWFSHWQQTISFKNYNMKQNEKFRWCMKYSSDFSLSFISLSSKLISTLSQTILCSIPCNLNISFSSSKFRFSRQLLCPILFWPCLLSSISFLFPPLISTLLPFTTPLSSSSMSAHSFSFSFIRTPLTSPLCLSFVATSPLPLYSFDLASVSMLTDILDIEGSVQQTGLQYLSGSLILDSFDAQLRDFHDLFFDPMGSLSNSWYYFIKTWHSSNFPLFYYIFPPLWAVNAAEEPRPLLLILN